MQAHGEFRFKSGLIVPNNVTLYGHEKVLRAAFQDGFLDLWVALCDAAPDQELQVADLNEPTIGVNGYARVALSKDEASWPTVGTLNGEKYIESKDLVYLAVGGDFDAAARRMAIVDSETEIDGDVIALSAAFPGSLTIGPTTIPAERTFRYRFYLR